MSNKPKNIPDFYSPIQLSVSPDGSVAPFPEVEAIAKAASSGLTLTTTVTDIPNLSVTFTCGPTGIFTPFGIVVGIFDFDISAFGVGFCEGYLNLGGTNQNGKALINDSAGNVSGTFAQVWWLALGGAGTTTVAKLRARKTINAGTATAQPTDTRMLAFAYGGSVV